MQKDFPLSPPFLSFFLMRSNLTHCRKLPFYISIRPTRFKFVTGRMMYGVSASVDCLKPLTSMRRDLRSKIATGRSKHRSRAKPFRLRGYQKTSFSAAAATIEQLRSSFLCLIYYKVSFGVSNVTQNIYCSVIYYCILVFSVNGYRIKMK